MSRNQQEIVAFKGSRSTLASRNFVCTVNLIDDLDEMADM